MAGNIQTSPDALSAVFDDLRPESPNLDLADEQTVAKEAKHQAGVIEWTAASSLLPEVARLLNVPLHRLLVGFWQKADEIVAALERSKASPEATLDVTLLDSKTEASFEPFIEVKLNGVSPGKKIPFAIVLPLTFKGVVLAVRNGEIVSASAGECLIEGCINLGALTVARLKNPVTIALGSGQDPGSR
jgi:hypothetical protein